MTARQTVHGGPIPLAQDHTIVYRHAPGAGRRVDGPGLARMSDGRLAAVVPVRTPQGWHCQVLRSEDGGADWQPTVQLPYYCAVPWEHENVLYLFAHPQGTTRRNDDLLLLRSGDGGRRWSDPVTLCRGHFWNCQTGMVRRAGRLYWAVDDLGIADPRRAARVVCGDLSGDPMTPGAWRISNRGEFPGLPPTLVNPAIDGAYPNARMLEPNVIEVGGRLRVLSCVKPPMQATTNLCAVFDVADDGMELEIAFTQYHPMPGGQVKFCILGDDTSALLWAAVNLAVDGQDRFAFHDPEERRGDGPYTGAVGGNDRRFLMLVYGLDGLNWFPAGCVARAARLCRSFMYPALAVDGDDLLVAARSSIAGENRHDADCITLHRVRNFRSLAMDLRPRVGR